MRSFDIDCTLAYELAAPTHLLFQIEAAFHDDQRIESESLEIDPPPALHRFVDDRLGNRLMRFNAPPGKLAVRYQARVIRIDQPPLGNDEEVPVDALPDQVLPFLTPTRFCESDVLGAAAYQLFGKATPGRARVDAIVDWIYDNIEYRIGSSGTKTTSRDVFVQRSGVCRDFAHLGISFCRALGIPARLVVGYVEFEKPPPDFHAVFEAWLGGRWLQFDATGLAPVDPLIRIGTGHDAKDVAFATFYGQAAMTSMTPNVSEVRR